VLCRNRWSLWQNACNIPIRNNIGWAMCLTDICRFILWSSATVPGQRFQYRHGCQGANCLELFMKLLYYIPMVVLASIILSALPRLINIGEACSIWKIENMDFLIWVEVGLEVAVIWLI
jgi:hypothetical protein